jgi:hypothetical protein
VNQVPVFINCRDRLTPLLELLDYLERAGCERIHLLDNDSAYPPLLEFYEQTPHRVIRFGENLGAKSLWVSGLLDELGVRGSYVFTDPDTVPIEECPLDAIEYFAEVLARYPGYVKAGFGLRIDDLPDHFDLKHQVIEWESRYWQRPLAPRLYDAPIGETFALYRGADRSPLHAIRTGYPYLVRHTTWYLDSADLPAEDRYYRERAQVNVTSWTGETVSPRLGERLEKRAPAAAPASAAPAPPGWDVEPRPVDEATFTAGASPGWHAWTQASPEVEFCDFAASMVGVVQPPTVIQTGTGEGFLTRRLREQIGPGRRLLCFESDAGRREALQALPWFDGRICVLSHRPRPGDGDLSSAGVSVLDSDLPGRLDELRAWWRAAQPGAVVLVHDARAGAPEDTAQGRLAALVAELGIPGTFLENPRGAFLGVKPG